MDTSAWLDAEEGRSMSNKPIPTRPISDNEELLREKFYESIASQSETVDKLSEHLLTLELAIPGLYATALKLVGGEKSDRDPQYPLFYHLLLLVAGL